MKSHLKPSFAAGITAVLAAVTALVATPVWADAQLAAEKGCVKCHRITATGVPSHAPTLDELVHHFENKRDRPDMEDRLARKIRTDRELAGITPHAQLTEDSAKRLARWLLAGAPR